MAKRLPTALFGLGLMLAACASPDASLAGEWNGTRPLPPGTPAGEAGIVARNVAAVKLTLHRDGKFELVDASLPFSGQWRREGDKISLDVDTVLNRPLATQPEDQRRAAAAYSAKVKDGKLLFQDLSGGLGVALDRTKREE